MHNTKLEKLAAHIKGKRKYTYILIKFLHRNKNPHEISNLKANN